MSCRNTPSLIAVQMINIHQNCLRIKEHNVNHDCAMNSAITFLICMNLPFASKADNSSVITYLWFCSTSIKRQPCGAGGSMITWFSSQWETSHSHLQLLPKIIQSKQFIKGGGLYWQSKAPLSRDAMKLVSKHPRPLQDLVLPSASTMQADLNSLLYRK